MSSMKRWRLLTQSGSFMKWDKEGCEIEGEFKGITDGRYGQIATLRTENGDAVFFATPINLHTQLEELEDGSYIKIVFLGSKVSEKSGRTYKSFNVFKADAELEESTSPAPEEVKP